MVIGQSMKTFFFSNVYHSIIILGKTGHFASGVQFLVAGIETTSTGLSWFMFEMCQRQDIQEKLREEIIRVLRKHNGQINYDAVQEMKYLDLCYLGIY